MHSKILVRTLHNHSLNIGTDILFQKVIRVVHFRTIKLIIN